MTACAGTLAIRADGGARMGFGHLVRSLTVGGAFRRRGWRVGLALRSDDPGGFLASPLLASLTDGVETIPLDADMELTPDLLTAWAGNAPADALLVDNYKLDWAFEAAMRPAARLVAALDDLADRNHDCDLLVDPVRRPEDMVYADRVPADSTVLQGPRYAVLRPGFAARRRAALARDRSTVRRIAVGLGATDPVGLTLPVLHELERVLAGRDIAVTVVLSSAAENLADVRSWIDARPTDFWSLAADVAAMDALLADTDLAVGALGGGSWERACLGVPSVVFELAENQALNAAFFSECGAAAVLTPDALPDGRFAATVAALVEDAARRDGMAARAAALVDGNGVERIADTICACRTGTNPSVTLRPMDAADRRALFDWQSEPGARRYSRDPRPPVWDGHCAWFAGKLADPYSALFVIEHGADLAGMVRLDPPDASGAREVSILVSQVHAGKGVATAALARFGERFPETALHAFIHPDNTASLRLFRGCGYDATGGDWYRRAPYSEGREVNAQC